jgi:tetratricopeptide (TPR) repeat protein
VTSQRKVRRLIVWGARVAVFAVVAGTAVVVVSRFMTENELLGESREAYHQANYARAADAARSRLESDSNDIEALRLLARSSARLGRNDLAFSLYINRIKTPQMQTEDFFLLGQIFARAGNSTMAIRVWQDEVKAHPDHPEILDSLARLAGSVNRSEEGAVAAERLSKIPGWEARGFLILGTCRTLIDDYAGGIAAFEKGLAIDPEARGAPFPVSEYRKALARNLLRLGRPAEARRWLAPVVAKGSDPEASWIQSRVEIQEGKFPEAEAAAVRAGSYREDHPKEPDPSPFVGMAKCRACHTKIAADYRTTRHARTFYHGKSLLDLSLPDRPLADPDDPKVTHGIEREGGQLRVSTNSSDTTARLLVEFAFGTPQRYVTMVGRDPRGDYRALRLSYYHSADGSGWGRTAGDVGDPDPAQGVHGQQIDVRDGVVRCLACHVTFPRDFRDPTFGPIEPTPAAADPGIGCEGCHGPGANHVAAAQAGLDDLAIVNLGSSRVSTIVSDCIRCHRVGDVRSIEQDPTNPKFVRSAGLTFTFSRCYAESGEALSCLTCHDPHREPTRDVAFYETKCRSCHAKPPQPASKGVAARVCKVNATSGCVKCHMPKIPIPALHASLTDHYIRIRERDPKREPQAPTARKP